MREEKINGKKVVIYDSIDELPIIVFQKFNKILLVDSGIGSDMNDVNTHLSKMMAMNEKGDKVNLRLELMNMSQNLAYAMNLINLKSQAFAVMVKSINGKEQTDISDLGLDKVIKKLNPSFGFIKTIIEELKKKLIPKLRFTSKTLQEIPT